MLNQTRDFNHWRLAVFVLTGANCFAFAQRQIIAFLAEPIRIDLGLSDHQIGFLIGAAFSISYATLMLPISSWVSKANQSKIVFMSVLAFSILTAISGFARNFVMILAARIGVGAAEAALTPSASSLLADISTRKQLTSAMGFYSSGLYLGGGIALIGGGSLAYFYDPYDVFHLPFDVRIAGWGMILVILGAIGVGWSLLCRLLKDPEYPARKTNVSKTNWATFIKHFSAHRSIYLSLFFAITAMIFVGSASAAWIPALFFRKFGWSPELVGINYGLVVTIMGTVGAILGGVISTRCYRSYAPARLLLPSLVGYALLIPISTIFPLLPNATATLCVIAVMNLMAGISLSGPYALVHHLTPAAMRGRAIAVVTTFVNIVAAGLSPSFVAWLAGDSTSHSPALNKALSITGAVISPLAFFLLLFTYAQYKKMAIVDNNDSAV